MPNVIIYQLGKCLSQQPAKVIHNELEPLSKIYLPSPSLFVN